MKNIRKVINSDLISIKQILDSIDLFPSEYLDEMINDYFKNEETQDIWFTKTVENVPIAFGYCAPEKLADGTFNLLALGIKPAMQGKGIGSEMIDFIETEVKTKNARILIIDTSSTELFEQSRAFYLKKNYTEEARIREYWGAGDDKVVFWKKLN